MKLSEKKFQELKENETSIGDLDDEYFIDPENDEDKIEVGNILKLLNENICSFEKIVDKCKSTIHAYNDPGLYRLLKNTKFFEKLIEENILTQEDTRYLWNQIDDDHELTYLRNITSLWKHIVANVSFKEIIDKFKSIRDPDNDPCLYYLLGNKEFFEELIQNNRLNKDDLRYLLNIIDNADELGELCRNTLLIKHILNEFVLNEEVVDKLNTIAEDDYWCEKHSIHTMFDWIEHRNKNNEEVLKLNELNKYVVYAFDLSVDQKDELIELIQNNEITKNRLIQIVDNHIESNYDFESLMRYLKKLEKKSLLNI